MNKVEKQFSGLSVFCVSKNKENQNIEIHVILKKNAEYLY